MKRESYYSSVLVSLILSIGALILITYLAFSKPSDGYYVFILIIIGLFLGGPLLAISIGSRIKLKDRHLNRPLMFWDHIAIVGSILIFSYSPKLFSLSQGEINYNTIILFSIPVLISVLQFIYFEVRTRIDIPN